MLDKRLSAILHRIPHGSIVADIGTDHAYLPCELMKQNITKKCYACDICEGPLNSAVATIQKAGLENYIEPILCAGLDKVKDDADVCVIAGMGWMTAKSILENDYDKLAQFKTIIVQVNRDVDELRKWIVNKKFTIQFEEVVFHKHYYVIVGFSIENSNEKYMEYDYLFGKHLLRQNTSVNYDYFTSILEKNKLILEKCQKDSEVAMKLEKQNQFLIEHLDVPNNVG